VEIKRNNILSALSNLPPWAPYAALALAVFIAYANVYRNEFLYDDLILITENKFLTSWRYIGTLLVTNCSQGSGHGNEPLYRPLMMLLYLFVYQAADLSTIAFHLLNVILHALNACLLFTLGVRLGFQRNVVLLASLFWALHPVQTEAVTYISGTADLLCGLLMLTGILILTLRFTGQRIMGACVLFSLALLSKETAVVFPLLVMGFLFYRSENRWHPQTYLKTWPFWLLSVFYFILRATILDFDLFGHYDIAAATPVTLADRFYTFLATLPAYLQLLVWPADLHMARGFPVYHLQQDVPFYHGLLIPQVAAGLLLMVIVFVGIGWKPSRRATPLAWGLLWRRQCISRTQAF
jgi:protein O-mannosyl-transferase